MIGTANRRRFIGAIFSFSGLGFLIWAVIKEASSYGRVLAVITALVLIWVGVLIAGRRTRAGG
jgi:hypothetical protein